MFVADWQVDSTSLRKALDALHSALERPFSVGAGVGALGHDREVILASLQTVLASIDRVDLTAVRALSGFVKEYRPDAQVQGLKETIEQLQESWHRDVARVLGDRKLRMLGRLLRSPTPDVLRILGREDDENSHSDLIAWLLSPRRAPNIAPAALRSLVAGCEDATRLCSAIDYAIQAQLVSIRREMLIGRELANSDDLCRVDIVVSGPDFVLAIENKVWSKEHADQTSTYWSWLEPMTCLRAGIIASPSGMTAACPHFTPISYLGLVSALLEGPTEIALNPDEEIVLASYLKTLARYILPVEMKAVMDAARAMEA